MSKKAPDILYIKGSEKDSFQKLVDKHSPLNKLDNKHVFILSMIFGYQNDSRVKLGTKRWNVTRAAYLDDSEKSLIKAIAIASENNLNVLLDKKKVYSIAEEYASGGIKYLREKVFGKYFGSFNKLIESELIEEFEKMEKERVNEKKEKNSLSRT